MGDLSQNFSRSEFACKDRCGQDTVDVELLKMLQWLRDTAGKPVRILSGNRCPAHNARVGGAKYSQHLRSRAADIQVVGMSPREVYALLDKEYPGKYGLGAYGTFVHVDSRSTAARWTG